MGKEIVYCHDCGQRLSEDDFERRRAHTISNQHFCVTCSPLPAPAQAASSTRLKAQALPAAAPRAPKPPRGAAPSSSRAPLAIGLAAGGLGLLVLVVTVASGGGPGASAPPPPRAASPATPEPPPSASVPKTPLPAGPRPAPAADPAEVLRQLEAFAATQPEPDGLLFKCDEARATLRGTPHEPRLRQIEERALGARRLRMDTARLDHCLAQVEEIRRSDAAFARRADVLGLLKAAASVGGARQAEAEQKLTDYEKGFREAAEKEARAVRAAAESLAAAGKYSEALAACDAFPGPFRATAHGPALEALRAGIERRAAEAARAERERRLAAWRAWVTASTTEDGAGQPRESHAGRENVLVTHPLSRETPASLERTFEIPAGKRSALELWAAPHENGDWELRILIDGALVERRAVGPKGSGWRRVRADLSPWAGKKVAVRLENAATGWAWEFGYWSDIEVREASGPEEIRLSPDAARRSGSIQLQGEAGAQILAGWFQDASAEWAFAVPRAGEYSIELTYALAPNNGGEFEILADKARLSARTSPTGGWNDYRPTSPGKLALPAGTVTLTLRPVKINGGLMNLREVKLVRLK